MTRTPIRWKWDPSAVRPDSSSVADPASSGQTRDSFELGRTYFGEGSIVVSLPARKFLSQPDAVRAVIQHELVHAVHASHAGTRARYEATPRWFREGVALLFAGEGEERVRERVAYTVFGGADATSFLKGISLTPGVSERLSDAEGYLAVLWLRAQLSRARHFIFVRRVVTGEGLARLVREQLGLGPSTASLEMRRAARAHIRALLAAVRQKRFHSLLRELEDRAPNVTSRLEVFLAENEAGPLAGTLRYLLAKEALRRGEAPRFVAAAVGHLEALRSSPGTLWRPEALVLLGQCYLRQGRRDAARRAWREVTEVFGEDRVVSREARKLLAVTEED